MHHKGDGGVSGLDRGEGGLDSIPRGRREESMGLTAFTRDKVSTTTCKDLLLLQGLPF